MNDIKVMLQGLRLYFNLTQEELSKKSGVSVALIRKIENENYIPKYTQSKKLADALNVSIYQIFQTDEKTLNRRVKE